MAELEAQIAGARAPRGSAEELASRAVVEARLFGRRRGRLTVSRYELESKLGAGGGGTVFVARDPGLDRRVALKLLESEEVGISRSRAIIAEARALAQLSHSNVVQIYDAGRYELGAEDGGIPRQGVFIVMELVRGPTLARWLQAEPRPWTAVVQHFIEAGRGLAAVHRAGILHRDFKPANVLVARDGTVKVTDFGLAKLDHSLQSSSHSTTTGAEASLRPEEQTARGMVRGTPRYMAPEQHSGHPLTAAVDQYAFCVALWEALSGRPPFSGKRLRDQKLAGPPPWNDDRTPRRIVRALRRGLSPDPGGRWPTMDELLRVLGGFAGRRRKRMLVGCMVVMGLAAGGLGSSLPARTAPGEPCLSESPESIWNPVVSKQIEQRLSSSPHRDAQVSGKRLVQRLDRFVEDWQELAQRACAGKAVRGDAEEVNGRLACLSRRRIELERFVELLRFGDDRWLANALEEAHRLPWPSICEAASGEAAASTRAVELEGRLFSVETMWRGGQGPEARALLEKIRTEAAALDDPALLASVHVAQGRLDAHARPQTAVSSFETGYHHAIAGRRWSLAAEAAASLVALHSKTDAGLAEATRWKREAQAIMQGHEVGELRGMLLTNAALADLEAGRYDDARTAMLAAIEVFRARPDGIGGEILNLSNLSALEVRSGNPAAAEAYARAALEQAIETYGPEHSATLSSRINLGGILEDAGQSSEGRAHLRDARAVAEAALPENHPQWVGLLHALMFSELADGRASVALELAQQAVQIAERAELPFVRRLPLLEARAIAQAHLGRHEQALAAYRALLVEAEERVSLEHPLAVHLASNFVGILRRAGRTEDAERAFTEAQTRLQSVGDLNGDSWARLLSDGARLSLDRDDIATAIERAERSVASTGLAPGHRTALLRQAILGEAWAAQGRAEGMLVMNVALAGLEAAHRPGHPVLGEVHHALGVAWLKRQEPALAVHHLEQALQIRRHEAVDPADQTASAEQLALARAQLARASDARRGGTHPSGITGANVEEPAPQ